MEQSYATIEDPDIVVWHLVGNVSAADVARIYEVQVECCRRKSPIFVVTDLRRMNNMSLDARRAATQRQFVDGQPMRVRGIAVIGGSFALRVLSNMVNRAVALLYRNPENPLRFFETDEEARAWFDSLRAEPTSTTK